MKILVALVVLWCLAPGVSGQAPPRLNVIDGIVYFTRLHHASTTSIPAEEKWVKVFSVFTEEAFVKKMAQPVAGKYALTADGFSFEPLYPFAGGATYHAVLSTDDFEHFINGHKQSSTAANLAFTFHIPAEKVSSTFIETVYPASEVLPENLLRMYLCFSGPMMPGEAYKHISLLNEDGKRIERPFLVVDQELWDASRTRLTLLFDPGRIKRGLKANLDLGPPLKEGEQYTLFIDSAWRDVHGNALQASKHDEALQGQLTFTLPNHNQATHHSSTASRFIRTIGSAI